MILMEISFMRYMLMVEKLKELLVIVIKSLQDRNWKMDNWFSVKSMNMMRMIVLLRRHIQQQVSKKTMNIIPMAR